MASIFSAPLSLYSIPAAWVLAYVPQLVRNATLTKIKSFDNFQPRASVSKALSTTGKGGADDKLKAKVARADAAHQNGLESFPLWSIAVLAANYAGLATRSINTTALVYLGSRALYNIVYIRQSKPWHGTVRSAVWFVGVVSALSLLVRSANLVART